MEETFENPYKQDCEPISCFLTKTNNTVYIDILFEDESTELGLHTLSRCSCMYGYGYGKGFSFILSPLFFSSKFRKRAASLHGHFH